MEDFFKKEITPFARVKVGDIDYEKFQEEPREFERWSFLDNGIFNRAVKVEWGFKTSSPTVMWTEFQRRMKHLLAVKLELDTMIDWACDSQNQNVLNMVKMVTLDKASTTTAASFWFWDEDIQKNGFRALIFHQKEFVQDTLSNLMVSAMKKYLDENVDSLLIDIKKQLGNILRSIYDIVICTCPWEGKITGGPMLPSQAITVSRMNEITYISCKLEFSILGARPIDLKWIEDLKFPAISPTALIQIHFGAARQENT